MAKSGTVRLPLSHAHYSPLRQRRRIRSRLETHADDYSPEDLQNIAASINKHL
ncbi:hypothetical protein PO124_22295 [Bacillus licheniformis]|nr:hypothetical protein [Bacillus licheniformis]